MARQILVLQVPGTPTAAQFEAVVNAQLAALVDPVILSVQIVLTDATPAYSRTYRVLLEYDDAGGVAMSQPFQVHAVEATDLADARTQLLAFRALNPGWFYATIDYRYTDIIPNISNRNIVLQFYCEDEPAGYLNWQTRGGHAGHGYDHFNNFHHFYNDDDNFHYNDDDHDHDHDHDNDNNDDDDNDNDSLCPRPWSRLDDPIKCSR